MSSLEVAPPPEIAPIPPSAGPSAKKSRTIGSPGGSGGGGDGGDGDGVGGGGGGAGPGGGAGALLPPSHVFQVPSGLAQCGPGNGAPSHSQQLLLWWPGEKFHVEHPTLQHAASHAVAVRLGSLCMSLHCSPARLCEKLQFVRVVVAMVAGGATSSSDSATTNAPGQPHRHRHRLTSAGICARGQPGCQLTR